MITVKRKISFACRSDGTQTLIVHEGERPASIPAGRVPRIARLMALAMHFDELVRQGAVVDYSAIARLAHVTQPRVTQILNLTLLAPDLQEALLFLPLTMRGRDPITERDLRHIVALVDWKEQRRRWQALRRERGIAR